MGEDRDDRPTEGPKVYTRTGDDGTTGLFFGGRVRKDTALPVAYGTVDEAQAALGLARAEAEPGSELDELLIARCRDLYVVMAELATLPANHHKLTPGQTSTTAEMVTNLEELIDDIGGRFTAPSDFAIPGRSRLTAALDLARTVIRRAERAALAAAPADSHVVAYLNRLSDLVWVLARWQEDVTILARDRPDEG